MGVINKWSFPPPRRPSPPVSLLPGLSFRATRTFSLLARLPLFLSARNLIAAARLSPDSWRGPTGPQITTVPASTTWCSAAGGTTRKHGSQHPLVLLHHHSPPSLQWLRQKIIRNSCDSGDVGGCNLYWLLPGQITGRWEHCDAGASLSKIKLWHLQCDRKNSAEGAKFTVLLVLIITTGPGAVCRPRTSAASDFHLAFHTAESGCHLHEDEV